MRASHCQKGSVLLVGLLILMVMTLLGVNTMLGSNLQERMVANQKQTIEASMAAEAGAVMAIRWVRAHPESWGDAEAWKANNALPSNIASAPSFGAGVVYWIESIRFDGDVATIVSRGGVMVADRVMGRSAVAVTFQNEDYGVDLARNAKASVQHGVEAGGDRQAAGGAFSASMVQAMGASTIDAGHDGPTGDTRTLSDGAAAGDGSNEINRSATVSTGKISMKIIAWKQLAGGVSGSDRE